jgi:hypothetical protein
VNQLTLFGKRNVPRVRFDGDTYDPARDHERLKTELGRVWTVMADGKWHTLAELGWRTEGSEAGVSARLRDLRKRRFGGYLVERKRITGGLYEYRLLRPDGRTL